MPVDVDRLMEKIHVVTVPAGTIPEYCEETNLESDSSIQVLAVQTTGSRAFEELVISRFLLYEKLYYHQKIRAIEGTVVNALEILKAERPEFARIGTYANLITELADRFKTFESHDGTRISGPTIRSWLLQFSANEIPLAVQALSAIKYWGRTTSPPRRSWKCCRFNRRYGLCMQ